MFKNKIIAADIILMLLYAAICGVTLFRIHVTPTGYLTLDSKYYLELAQNLKEGNGFLMSNQYPFPAVKTPQNQIFFSVWPAGYPVLIFTTSVISGLEVFWASKVLNLFLLALSFLTLRYINRQYSFVLGSIHCAYTFAEIYSFTWSEAAFIPGALWLTIILHHILQGKKLNRHIILLFLTCLYLFLVRYIGIFTFALPAAGTIYYQTKKSYAISRKFLYSFLGLCLFAITYFSINYYHTGTVTGGDRLAGGTETATELVLMFLKAVLNELFIIRNYSFSALPDTLFIITVLIQGILLFLVIREIKNTKGILSVFRKNYFSHTCLVVAGLYLILVTALRTISPFDALDYRILSPFTFLLLIGSVNYIVAIPDYYSNFKKVKLWIFSFFIFSLLLNLPKRYLLQKLMELL